MKNFITSLITTIIVAVVICSLFVIGQSKAPSAGGSFNVVYKDFTGGASIGPGNASASPILVSNLLFGAATCTGSSTISAGAKVNYDCTISGVKGLTAPQTQERVFITLASTTPQGVVVSSAYASTTADNSIRLVLSTASSSPVTPILTDVRYLILR